MSFRQDIPLENLQVFRKQTFEHLMVEDSIIVDLVHGKPKITKHISGYTENEP